MDAMVGEATTTSGVQHAARRRRQAPLPRVPLPRQLDSGALITLVAELPSRAGMRKPREDYADNLIRFHNALWRHAHAVHSGCFRMTWDQIRAAGGYEPKSYRRLTMLVRYAKVLEEAGVMTISGLGELADRRTCVVTLHTPPNADAVLSEAAERGEQCEARRRRESRSQRQERRVRPYVAKGGRGRAVQRWDFTFGPYVSPQGVLTSDEVRTPSKPCVGAHARGGLVDAIEPPVAPADSSSPGGTPPTAGATLDWAPSPRSLGAELEALRTASARGGVVELFAAAATADVLAIAIVGWELLIVPELERRVDLDSRARDVSPKLSRKRRDQLRRSVAVIDRVQSEAGAGARHLLGLMEAEASDLRVFDDPDRRGYLEGPYSLGFFVAELRQSARKWRRHWRGRRAQCRPPVKPADRVDDLPRGDAIEVDLGGPQRLVPELALDQLHPDALASHVRGVGVPQAVGSDPLLDPGLPGEVVELDPEAAVVQPAPDAGSLDHAEHGAGRPDAELCPPREPELDDGQAVIVDADGPPAAALAAQDGDLAGGEVDVLRQQRERLADPQPGAPQQRDQRAVTDPGAPTTGTAGHQGVDLLGRGDLGGVLLTGVPGLHAQTVAGEGDDAAAASSDQRRAGQSLLLLVDGEPEGTAPARAPDGGLAPPPGTSAQPTQEDGCHP